MSSIKTKTITHPSSTDNLTLNSNGSISVGNSTVNTSISTNSTAVSIGGVINYNNSATANSVFIDDSGRVLKPNHPGFYTRRSTSGDGRGNGVQEWNVAGVGSYNSGSHFNASNGRFTAPVAGIYCFEAAPGYKQTNVNFNWYWRINGGNVAEPVRILGGLSSHSLAARAFTVYLNEDDYVDINMGSTHHVNTTLNYFCGYLIG